MGQAAALHWYQHLRPQTRQLLTHFPLSQPLAPESADIDSEIRQMIFRRYRLIFEIEGRTVRILHLLGAFNDGERGDLGVNG